MELNENYLLDDFFGLRREMNWESAIIMPTEMNFDCFDFSNNLPIDPHNFGDYLVDGLGQFCNLPADQFTAASTGDSMSYNTLETTPSSFECAITSMEEEEEEIGILEDEIIHNLEVQASCKIEAVQSTVFNSAGTCDFEQKIGGSARKKIHGQPSKNLMAERRRRKRLNDRLSMLRSIVPKISKMERTAIVGDAIEYVKELLEKINNLQREIEVENPSKLESTVILREVKPNEYLVRNSPKFNVEIREDYTRIEIWCVAKPGLLLSTMETLEALGFDVHQCVISCFNHFAIQASCSQVMKQKRIVSREEVKQALFENAGYGGRCP